MESSSERRAAFLRHTLADRRFREIEWVAETGSTNDDLAAVASIDQSERVLATDRQTAGRGRRNRVWSAPAGSSVLLSVLVRRPRPELPFWTIGAASVAAAEAIEATCGVRCAIKWPNDLLVGEAKVAGILAQSGQDWIIVGSGINVNWPATLPPELAATATSLNRHAGYEIDRVALVEAYLVQLEERLVDEPDRLRGRWRDRCGTIGREVTVDRGDQVVAGTAIDIDSDGALIVDHDGDRSAHHVGDVVHLRPG